MEGVPRQRSTSGRTVAGIVAMGWLGEIAPMVMPLLLVGIIDAFGVTAGTAGLAASVEIAGIAGAAAMLAATGPRIRPRLVIRFAVGLVVFGQGSSLIAPSWPLLLASRLPVGIGEGVFLAMASMQASRTVSPHRVFSLLLGTILFLFTGLTLVIPAAVSLIGPRGGFAVLFGLVVIAAPILLTYKPLDAASAGESGPAPIPVAGWRVLAGAMLVYLGFSGLWTYGGEIGSTLGLSLTEVSRLIMVCGLLGAVGPATAGVAGLRWGWARPILLGLALVVAAGWGLSHAPGVVVFGVAVVVVLPAFMGFVTYVRGLMAAIDSTGRLVGLGMGFLTFGASLGPLIAGQALDAGAGFGALGVMMLAVAVVAGVLLGPAAAASDRTVAR